jgi:hypothetical protein
MAVGGDVYLCSLMEHYVADSLPFTSSWTTWFGVACRWNIRKFPLGVGDPAG